MKRCQNNIDKFFTPKKLKELTDLEKNLYYFIIYKLKRFPTFYHQITRRGITIYYIRIEEELFSYLMIGQVTEESLYKLIKKDFDNLKDLPKNLRKWLNSKKNQRKKKLRQ